jgi:uncharacterized protein YecE (DUF72 family)
MNNPELHVGTSGWAYDDWAEVFYPKGTKAADRLAYYATQFDTLEINASFYRVPSQAAIDAWNARLPESYHLVVKGPKSVTHTARLRDCEEPLQYFLDRVLQLRALRIILWQLPPSLSKDLPRLEAFLNALPGQVRHAVEFRHVSWWDGEAADLLARHGAAMVAVSHPGMPDSVQPTTDFLFVRFHGMGKSLYRYDYSRDELLAWDERLRPFLRDRAVYAFFNNGYEGHAPRNARLFRELLMAQ